MASGRRAITTRRRPVAPGRPETYDPADKPIVEVAPERPGKPGQGPIVEIRPERPDQSADKPIVEVAPDRPGKTEPEES